MNQVRRAVRFGALVLAVSVCGCGSSDNTQVGQAGAARAPKASLKESDRYKYVGEGAEKRKVTLTRREQNKLLAKPEKAAD
jgi:hypothetical protein